MPVSLVYLADPGIHENGQLLQADKNNLDIAAFAFEWLKSREEVERRENNLTDISSVKGTVTALGKAWSFEVYLERNLLREIHNI